MPEIKLPPFPFWVSSGPSSAILCEAPGFYILYSKQFSGPFRGEFQRAVECGLSSGKKHILSPKYAKDILGDSFPESLEPVTVDWLKANGFEEVFNIRSRSAFQKGIVRLTIEGGKQKWKLYGPFLYYPIKPLTTRRDVLELCRLLGQ